MKKITSVEKKQYVDWKEKIDRIHLICAVIFFVAMFLMPSVASATPFTSADAQVAHFNGQQWDDWSINETGASSASIASGGASASASTTWGVQHFYSYSPSADYHVWSDSTWREEFTIAGGTGNDSITFNASVTGELSGDTSWFYYVLRGREDIPGSTTELLISTEEKGTSTVNQLLSGTFTFTYGVPFAIESVAAGYVLWGASGYIDFSSSVILTDIVLPDGATISAASGTQYPIGSGTVPSPEPPIPEPSTMLLLASGFIGLLTLRRKRKKTR